MLFVATFLPDRFSRTMINEALIAMRGSFNLTRVVPKHAASASRAMKLGKKEPAKYHKIGQAKAKSKGNHKEL